MLSDCIYDHVYSPYTAVMSFLSCHRQSATSHRACRIACRTRVLLTPPQRPRTLCMHYNASSHHLRNMNKLFAEGPKQPPRRDDFDDIAEGETVRMRNEGGYAFSLEDSEVRDNC